MPTTGIQYLQAVHTADPGWTFPLNILGATDSAFTILSDLGTSNVYQMDVALASLGQVPANATILSATVTVVLSVTGSFLPNLVVRVQPGGDTVFSGVSAGGAVTQTNVMNPALWDVSAIRSGLEFFVEIQGNGVDPYNANVDSVGVDFTFSGTGINPRRQKAKRFRALIASKRGFSLFRQTRSRKA